MSLTKKGTAWEIKNSIFSIMAIIPIINCTPFFYMNNRIENKKWLICGWVSLILQIIAVGVVIGWSFFAEAPEIDYTTQPSITDYLGYNFREKYGDEYTKLPEYEEYQKAKDEWHKTPEYLEQYKEREEFSKTSERIGNTVMFSMIVIYIVNLILVITERAKYLKMLEAKQTNREIFSDKMKSNNTKKVATNKVNETKSNIKKTDINSATEDELISNLGITIVDAKKIIQYRENNGNFTSKDEFFECINAKPHIIAKLQDYLVVEQSSKSSKNNQNYKRRVDI